MGKILILALGAVSILSADQYSSNYQNIANQETSLDQQISSKIQEELSKGFRDVSFEVNNGVVNLRGSVDTLGNKKKAEDSIKKIKGVKQINNQIIIIKQQAN